MPEEPTQDLILKADLATALQQVNQWARIERRDYADKKFEQLRAKEIHIIDTDPHLESSPHIFHGIGDYMKRAEMFGLDTYQGRQALGKALITIESLLCDAIVAHGPMPRPGFTSGVIQVWDLWQPTRPESTHGE
jgi:hypothetical protein